MDVRIFSEWLSSLSLQDRTRALIKMYSSLTVGTRQLFLPDMPKGKEAAIIKMLQGINELHHTVANWLLDYSTDERKAFPVETLGEQLLWIADQYGLRGLLNSTVEYVRTGAYPAKP
jgi:hypothetical protein